MSKFHQQGKGQWAFRCPGCENVHVVHEPVWQFNGNLERPTVSPSVLVVSGCKIPGHPADARCWCTYNAEARAEGKPEAPFQCRVCHSFVRDGQIQFLPDCTHALAGKTVALPDWGSA